MEKKHFAKVNKETNEVEGVFIYSETPSFPKDELWIETFEDGSQRKHPLFIIDTFVNFNHLKVNKWE